MGSKVILSTITIFLLGNQGGCFGSLSNSGQKKNKGLSPIVPISPYEQKAPSDGSSPCSR
ncbi:hypothetical protein [Cardinium endosymbiont of Nabis limbatus]|uniref:hypothetical protein n=1 Tax=Cardinium endosymbiont of Nabis limbatus TaxID=3066217 RepID=UPI003AF3853A